MGIVKRFPVLSGDWARALLAPALVFIATSVDRSYQTDFWHHLARGRAIAETGTLVNEDLFTYTVAHQPFQDTNWLTQLFYYHVYQLGGLPLIQAVNSLTLAAMMGVLVFLCWRACRSWMLASAVGVFSFFGMWQLLIIRPQTFSLLLFVLLYAVLLLAERRRWLLLLAPPILALWTNLHGGFPIGLILVGCFLAAAVFEGAWQRRWGVLRDGRVWLLGLCLAGCVAATLANPYGWNVYQYVRTTSSAASARRIDEWIPPGLDLFIGKMWVLSVLAVLVLFALPRRRPTAREVCLVLCFLPLACGSVRMVTWWLLVSARIATALLAETLPGPATVPEPERPSRGAALAFGLLVLTMIAVAPPLEGLNPLLGTVRSLHRDEYDLEEVSAQLAGRGETRRIFSRFEWGEYVGWELSPAGYTVFMDGRIEIFPDDVWANYAAVTKGRADWEEILDHYQVDCLLLDASYHGDLLPQVERSPQHWQRVSQVGK